MRSGRGLLHPYREATLMPINESLSEILDKDVEQKPLKEIIQLSPGALQGLTYEKAELLKQALNVKTIEDLANNRFVRWSQALTTLAEREKL